jgi:tetratricopeptide (TPR) repeat protein
MRLLALAVSVSSLISAAGAMVQAASSAPPAQYVAAQTNSERITQFLEQRVRRDPEDITALNRLAGLYLQRARETGAVDYLLLAGKKATQSLAAVPEAGNIDGLALRCRVAFESHEFGEARDAAGRLVQLASDKASSYAFLGDALLELGDYAGAEAAYARMRELDPDGVGTLARLARLAFLKGDATASREHLQAAVDQARQRVDEAPEPAAWCAWQLGELAFATGDYPAAEGWYRQSLECFPAYFRALASLGRVRAAREDLTGAIEQYEHAVAIVPDPTSVAALGDLYEMAGRPTDARRQYDLVGKIARLSAFYGALYNRQFALFRADHHLAAAEAYADAMREYEVRKDVFGADAVAWTALRAGKIDQSRAAVHDALRLGTPDAKLLYHAGMIALAAGERTAAQEFLTRAMKLNPRFDPLQARQSGAALESLRSGPAH